eukprot:s2987_g7.t1
MLLLRILVGTWHVLPSGGDGTSIASTPSPIAVSVCNPFRGHRYLSIGAAGGISSTSCFDSWDLYEIEAFTTNGQLALSASSSVTGGYVPSNAVDGDTSSFWAGDHDVGMSCSCWNDSKKDGELLTIDLGSNQQVTQLKLHQGGIGNQWAVKRVRLHCHDALPFSSALVEPLEIDVSMGLTTIECNERGCTTSLSPPYRDTCKGFGAKLAGSLAVLAGFLLL